jgi:hypothetical protein
LNVIKFFLGIVFKSPYNFTIVGCLEEHYGQDITKPILVNCISDMTPPDEKYGPFQNYFGIYQPSQDTYFYNFNKSSDHTALISVSMALIILDSNYTPDMGPAAIQMNAFDSGKVIKRNCNYI